MLFSIYVDADSIIKPLRSIILNASIRLDLYSYFVSDRILPDVRLFIETDTHRLRVENNSRDFKSKIKMVVVEKGLNSADDYIVDHSNPYDLCITHDIPLAKRLLDKGCYVINDRGREYEKDTINSLLMDRNVNTQLREMGVFESITKKQGLKETHDFASSFDRLTSKLRKL